LKRSKMVELLLEYDDELLPMQAEDIINFLESKGMLPPAYEKFQEAPVLTMYLKVKVNEWEPEND